MNHEIPINDKKIGIIGCRHTTYDTVRFLQNIGYELDMLITIDVHQAKRYNVGGYSSVSSLFKPNQVHWADTYELSNPLDITGIKAMAAKIDIFIVIGWQRLVPEWLLDIPPLGAFGCHGSSELLPKGRGRSAINWCLIEGRDMFKNHLFRYKPGADDGDIVDIRAFELFPWDNIQTAHAKYIASFCKMLEKNLPSILDDTAKYMKQKGIPTYYGKRTPEMGEIDWRWDTAKIYNLIRGVTKPYPGAFAIMDGKKIMIWDAIPWSYIMLYNAQPGTVVEEFSSGWHVVKTGDGALLIREWEEAE